MYQPFNDLNEWDNDNNNYDKTLLSSESRSRLNIAQMKKEAEGGRNLADGF